MNIQEIGAGISHFVHRKQIAADERLARTAALTFARLAIKAEKQGDTLGAQIFSDAMDKAVADFLPQESSPKTASPAGSVR